MGCSQCKGTGQWTPSTLAIGDNDEWTPGPGDPKPCPLCDETGEQKYTWPFSCGTQSLDWKSRNCDRCTKGYDYAAETWRCEIERSIDDGFMGDGKVPMETWRRMGGEVSHKDGGFPLTWDCLEREQPSGEGDE